MPSGRDRRLRQDAQPGRDLLGRQPLDALAVEQHRARLRLQQPAEARAAASTCRRRWRRRCTVILPGRDRDGEVGGDLDLVVGEAQVRQRPAMRAVAGRCAHRLTLRSDLVGPGQQPQQVRRADDAGDDADRELGRREQPAGDEVGGEHEQRAGDAAAGRIVSAGAQRGGGRSARRRTPRTRSARPTRWRRRRGHAPTMMQARRGPLDRRRPRPVAVSSPSCSARSGRPAAATTGTSTTSATTSGRTCSHPRPLRLPVSHTVARCGVVDLGAGQQVRR